ncbi:MAG: GAF domain-containing protein [Gemmatimonadetes bacterium]|nr:GAF domain-containing protein [Gemmatimonadota bacterium]
MKATLDHLSQEYTQALEDYLSGVGESALERAYQLGRRAVEEGVGVLEMAELHADAVLARLRAAGNPPDSAEIVERGERFLIESLSPYEMTHRGFREANSALRQLNQTLEQRVAERTREAELARVRAEAEEQRSRYLAEASELLGRSLHYRDTLAAIARLSVPMLGDWCVVDVVEPPGRIRRVATAHGDPELEPLVDQLRRFPPDPGLSQGIARVLRTGAAELVPHVTQEWLDAVARDHEHRALLERLDPQSCMIVPLLARQQPLGALSFARRSPHPYTARDLSLAEDVAHRAALALENALLYRSAQEANQAKSDFLAVMSHELRTPLNAIMGYADLLDAGISGPLNPKQSRQLARIQASARHLLELIEEILSFSRVEAGREGLQAEELDARALAREAAEVVEPAAAEQGLTLQLDLPDGPLHLQNDARKLRQILINLLSNAVKFTSTGGVRLGVRQQGEEVLFQVSDTGIGIPPEHLEKIFEPFWQVEQTPTRRVGGTGLGLSVARRLARLMRGDVSVKSEPGKGSTFTVRVPLRLDARRPAA